jgi:2,5-diamino-6-(ribosylamino)-4(3H)-pyrimidinone 5'-phosphate reductase
MRLRSTFFHKAGKAQFVLPFVYINVAMTADGKIAPANRKFVAFGSKTDQRLLLELRTGADAVMAGARTVDLVPVNLGPGPAKYRRLRVKEGLAEYNLRVVVSGHGTLNPSAAIFKRRFSPIIVLASGAAPEKHLRRLRAVADEVGVFGENEVDFRSALKWLRKKWDVKRLLCEGGGEVNAALFRAGLIDEVYLTICPLIFGGRNAPTMADGIGVSKLAHATELRLKSLKRLGPELYLVYRVDKKSWV